MKQLIVISDLDLCELVSLALPLGSQGLKKELRKGREKGKR